MPVRLISSGGAVIGGVSGDTTPISSSLDTHGIEQARPDLWPPGATAHLERLVAARGDRMHCSWATVAGTLAAAATVYTTKVVRLL
jgi:hypothetical protein